MESYTFQELEQFGMTGRRLRALLEHASKDETRYNLAGLCIEPHGETGAQWVATDGHRLAVLAVERLALDPPCALWLPRADAERLVKVAGINGRILGIGKESAQVVPAKTREPVSVGIAAKLANCGGDGAVEFPNWRQVLPRADRMAQGVEPGCLRPIHCNAGYLADACAFAAAAGFSHAGAVSIEFAAGGLEPLLVHPSGPAEGIAEAFALVMPMRA